MKIQSVCHLTGLGKTTLRYYERMGLIKDIPRDAAGHRDYAPDQLDWIALIKRLRATGMPMDQLQKLAKLREEGEKSRREYCHILENHRNHIQRLLRETETHLRVMEEKIQACLKKKTSHRHE
ncbi:MerR family transcriptional regulator [Desulfobotulus sp.]|jgi:DNA-binding transcriptional MerR regulator|uniref:MerR family transcriptional regulator n=1 Tax=Desulfobotulus sp. TaxID=1940337 RepID=UPI002A363E2C|nr:MerR family transcriptional regulator [Desulfobotulus sp.]MDY0163958.1 MerR family transcriptional regulator [Desulfobotulus sp.]